VASKQKSGGDLVVAEDKEIGSIRAKDISNLLKFSVGNSGFFLYFFFATSAACMQLYTTYWVSYWTE
jgi:hypothetical protein